VQRLNKCNMGRAGLAALLTQGECGHGAVASYTSFAGSEDSNVSGNGQTSVIDRVVKGLDAFDSDFQAYAKTDKQFPPLLKQRWEAIYNSKDPLQKVKDRMWQCDNYEQALTGPRPDVKGQVADEMMKSSVSARVNTVVNESSELVAMCEKAERLIGDRQHPGVADQINALMKKLDEAKRPIHDMMVGSDDEQAGGADAAVAKSVALPPFLAALLQPPPLAMVVQREVAERRQRTKDGRLSIAEFL